jgi:hypothetical protein
MMTAKCMGRPPVLAGENVTWSIQPTSTSATSTTVTQPGTWGAWSAWSTCNSQCGPGIQSRGRTCATSSPCSGDDSETQDCSAGRCDNAGRPMSARTAHCQLLQPLAALALDQQSCFAHAHMSLALRSAV